MAKNGKKSDIVHKGGRGSSWNHTFELMRKNDKAQGREALRSENSKKNRQLFSVVSEKRGPK